VNEFGGDVLNRIAKAGFSVEVVKDRKNPLISTIVATRINGSMDEATGFRNA
jgi:hypothetical protein